MDRQTNESMLAQLIALLQEIWFRHQDHIDDIDGLLAEFHDCRNRILLRMDGECSADEAIALLLDGLEGPEYEEPVTLHTVKPRSPVGKVIPFPSKE